MYVRGCHAGKGGMTAREALSGEGEGESQFASLERMDRLVRHAARAACVPMIDVWQLDKAAGFYESAGAPDFHVPNIAALQAALAALLVLRLRLPFQSCSHR